MSMSNLKNNRKILIMGLGWLGLPLALRLRECGYDVCGTTTTHSKELAISFKFNLPTTTFLLPHTFCKSDQHTSFFLDLSKIDTIIFNIPPQKHRTESGYPIEECLNWLKKEIGFKGKLIFISSTSVYGKTLGNVDESSMPQPETISGHELFLSEKFIQNNFDEHNIIRPGGLIGGMRHPIKSLQGKLNLTNGADHLHLVDRDTLVDLIIKSVDEKIPNIINAVLPYNKNKKEYYEFMAQKLGLKKPEYQQLVTREDKTCISSDLFVKILGRKINSPEEFEFNEELFS